MKLTSLASILAVSLFSSSVFAAPSKADQLFVEGRTLLNEGDYAGACKKFEESRAIDAAASTVLNLGLCNEKQGKYIEAAEYYRNAALALRGAGRAEAEKHAAEAEKMIAKLTVKKSENLPADARVTLDGNVVRDESFGEPIPVNPGTLELVVDAQGRERVTKSVQLEAGATQEIVVEAGAELAKPDVGGVVTKPGASKPSPLRTAGIIVGGVGVASLIAGTVTGLVALSNAGIYRERCVKNGTVDAQGNPADACTQSGLDAGHCSDTFAMVSTITFIAGGVLAAGGLTMILIAPKVGKKSQGTLQFTPIVGPTVAGASVGYTF